MPVELRKRKAPASAPELPSKKSTPLKKTAASKETASKPNDDVAPDQAEKSGKIAVNHVIGLDGFGGEVETNDGKKVTLMQLVEESKAGVVLFTYPKANTGGCTKQACLFRDEHEDLTSTGLSIFGLSADGIKSNTSFKTKQNLPYPLLCDPAQTLISAIGMKKAPKSTQRGVFVIVKQAGDGGGQGKVLAAEAGSPAGTIDIVKAVVKTMKGDGANVNGGSDENSVEKKAEKEDEDNGKANGEVETEGMD